MTRRRDLDAARAALVMINPAPYNAEAPPAPSLARSPPPSCTTSAATSRCPTHDGTLEIGGAVDNPTTLTLDDLRAMPAHDATVTLECAGNGRLEMRPLPTGEPWGDYAVSTARWTGALLHEVLAQARPSSRRRRRPVRGRRPRRLPPQAGAPRHRQGRPDLRARPAAAHAADPAAGILIAYEMNGEPLGPTTAPRSG